MTALIPFRMLLELDCDTEVVATIKKNSHRKFNNQKLIMNNDLPPYGNLKKW